MGSFKILCPACGARYDVENEYRGQMVACPKCGIQFVAEPPKTTAAVSVKDDAATLQTARIVYVILGLFGGMIGLHDLFCGRDVLAAIKALLTATGLLLLPIGGAFALLVVALWVIIDIINLLDAVPHREKRVPTVYVAVVLACIITGVALNIYTTKIRADRIFDDIPVYRP